MVVVAVVIIASNFATNRIWRFIMARGYLAYLLKMAIKFNPMS